jgi:hypothetical protein
MTSVPEPLLEPLISLMQAIVDRDYDALVRYSRGRLDANDIRRMVEEVYGGRLAMPPLDHYAHEVLMDEDDPEQKGFFLDLWDGEDIADLHMTGYLQRRPDGTFEPVLRDIAP